MSAIKMFRTIEQYREHYFPLESGKKKFKKMTPIEQGEYLASKAIAKARKNLRIKELQ
jgi:hypothetical protein